MQLVSTKARATWRAVNEGGLVCFVTEGEACPLIGGQLLGACSAYMKEVNACGLIADYSRTRMLITAEELTSNLRRAAATSRTIATPAALLVRPDDMPQVMAYARALAQVGIVRGVFNDFESAHRWASQQLQIHADEVRRGSPEAE